MLAQCLTQGRFNIHPDRLAIVSRSGVEAFAAAYVLQHAFKVECLASCLSTLSNSWDSFLGCV